MVPKRGAHPIRRSATSVQPPGAATELRPPHLILLALVLLVSAGCASLRPDPGFTSEPSTTDEIVDTIDGLAAAQAEYYAGVRAFVAEDLEGARTRFHKVREILAFAPSESVVNLAARCWHY